MYFSRLVSYFEQLEATSKRLELFAILAELFREADPSEINQIVYLLQGELLPPFHGINIGMSEKYLLRAIASAGQIDAGNLLAQYRLIGDLGKTAEAVIGIKTAERSETVSAVYQLIYQMARMEGEGSVDRKIEATATLLSSATAVEAKYIARFIAGQLRLGAGDATILEALALSHGDRSFREKLDRAYNLTSDLGLLAKTFCESGPEAVLAVSVKPGYPIRPALCERLASPEAIIEKIGFCSIEIKYDGFRCQAHKTDTGVVLFSRNQERMTLMFPEIVEAIETLFKGQEIILEGEALALNEATGESFPFQVTMQRKRKHGIEELSKTVPLKWFVFDLFYLNGVDYTQYPYAERRKKLIELVRISKNPVIEVAEAIETDDAKQVTTFFDDVVERGFEGVVAKRPDSLYAAGSRNFSWIKLKRSYKAELTDSLDLCIIGYFVGKGHRASFGIGTVLAAAYDSAEGRFKTVSKIGTGFSEQELQELKTLLDTGVSLERPREVDSEILPDVWVCPKYVVTVTADEITRSPHHTAGRDADGIGFALRFPRVQGFIRTDKGPYDATTVSEIIGLFNQQRRIKME
jgi:DNA ligase-1